MKKLVLFFAAVVFTAISANLYAQNTGETPTPGSTWNYSVSDNGNDYEWTVTKGDLTTDASADVTLDPLSADEASVNITWDANLDPNVDPVYYVHILETDANLCSNEKVLKVTITASQFFLSITAADGNACYDDAVLVSLNTTTGEPEYNHGTATALYTVTPTGMGTATGYTFDITELFTPSAGLSSEPTVTSGNGSVDAGTGKVTVTDANAVTLQFVVTNATLYDNTSDAAGTAADFNQKILHSSGITSKGVSDNGAGLPDANTNVARPHTTTIGSN